MYKKIAFIIPYFGKFNNYFQIWLHSCRYNPTIDWLIFTDDNTIYNYPNNVKVFYTSFAATILKIQKKFDFKIELNNPYELCEYKVTYGEVYSEYLEGYDFWGHCDVDVIWGNLRKHITEEILNNYSKISWRGHLTLYKNDKRTTGLYRSIVQGVEFYKYAFTNNTGFPVWFEERIINSIFENEGEKIYTSLLFADLKIRSFNFFLLHLSREEEYKNINQIFFWKEGNLFRIYNYDNKMFFEDFAYVHFLKRQMVTDKNFKIGSKFLIVPNKFINCTSTVTSDLVNRFSKQKFYWNYILLRLTYKYFLSKLSYWRSRYIFRKKNRLIPLKPFKLRFPPVTNSIMVSDDFKICN